MKLPKYFFLRNCKNVTYKRLWKLSNNSRYLCYSSIRYRKYSKEELLEMCKKCVYKKVCILRSSHLTCIDLDSEVAVKNATRSSALEFYLKKEV